MKSISKFLLRTAVAFSIAAMLPSCALDEPFGAGKEGTLNIVTEMRGDVVKTRALIEGEERDALLSTCVVYIENDRGVIRKAKGIDEISQPISLRTGSYVAEAWAGDSVSASFDKKFYRAYQPFEMKEGANSLTLKCNIANVLVSLDPASLEAGLTDMKVTFSHSRASLEFTQDNVDQKGYFMMPNADKDLAYKVEGKMADGTAYSKEGVIANVERAHEYCLKVTSEPAEITEGGAWIKISIADIPLIEEEVVIVPGPSASGIGFDLADQVVSLNNTFTDVKVYVRGFYSVSSIVMNVTGSVDGVTSGSNILDNTVMTELNQKGIVVEHQEAANAASGESEIPVDEYFITFTSTFLNSLPSSTTEYRFEFLVTDDRNKTGSGVLRIANNADAVEHLAPVVTGEAPDTDANPLAVGAHKATLTGYIQTEEALNYGIMYREQGTSEWLSAYPSASAAAQIRRNVRQNATRAMSTPYEVTVTGLKAGTVYEFKAFCDDFDGASVNMFTTESYFTIVNASFEDWSTYKASTLLGTKNVTLPGSTGDKLTSFWGSGNEGSATANMTLTTKFTDFFHSGTACAKLGSAKAAGVLAAGNIFVGYYDKTDGTNGVLQLGREYNGSHPSKLRFYANYRPGTVDIINDKNTAYIDIASGDNDHGQVYVALTDGTYEIRTNPSNRQLFSPDLDCVIAYGQVTWTQDFGADNTLELVEIPLTYNEKANTKRPTHIVIVASASKFGDFFSGSSSSVMYLDDFELVYE